MVPAIYCQRAITSELVPANDELPNAVEGLENRETCRDSGRCQPGEVDLMQTNSCATSPPWLLRIENIKRMIRAAV